MSAHAPAPYEIVECRGVLAQTNCRFAMLVDSGFVQRLDQCMVESGWSVFLKENIVGPILHHHAFRMAVAACPNGCSRPHIADIGIIRACSPVLDPTLCTCCSLCYRACPDAAITMDNHGPLFDLEKCMQCGLCVAKCREKALSCQQMGYRVVLGGKLGRHPRLATEFSGIHSEERVLSIVATCLDYYMREYRRGLRFGTLIEEQGEALLYELESV